jgi:hypothetical protein
MKSILGLVRERWSGQDPFRTGKWEQSGNQSPEKKYKEGVGKPFLFYVDKLNSNRSTTATTISSHLFSSKMVSLKSLAAMLAIGVFSATAAPVDSKSEVNALVARADLKVYTCEHPHWGGKCRDTDTTVNQCSKSRPATPPNLKINKC